MRTCCQNELIQLAPPGYPLVDPGLGLGRVVTCMASVRGRLTPPPWALACDPLITDMVEWACAILVELVMLLAQVVGGARASCRVKLPVPRQLALILITRRRNTWGRRLRRGRGRGIHTYRPDSPVQESVIATQGSCRGYLPATARVLSLIHI